MAVAIRELPIRRALALALALCATLACAGPLCAEDKPSLWDKLRGRGKPRAPKAEAQGPLATLQRKLAEAKTERQQLSRLGADPADLHRMDARIAGIEELAELVIRRQEMVRSAQPRQELAALDQRILDVRQNLRRVARVLPAPGAPRFDPRQRDLWSAPRGSRAARAYEDGALRRSMGI